MSHKSQSTMSDPKAVQTPIVLQSISPSVLQRHVHGSRELRGYISSHGQYTWHQGHCAVQGLSKWIKTYQNHAMRWINRSFESTLLHRACWQPEVHTNFCHCTGQVDLTTLPFRVLRVGFCPAFKRFILTHKSKATSLTQSKS